MEESRHARLVHETGVEGRWPLSMTMPAEEACFSFPLSPEISL